nr:movement protein [Ixeridium yellow mottle virus 2]
MTNVFNVYTPNTSKQPRGTSANTGKRPPPGVGRIRDGHNNPGARRRESHVRTPPAPKGPQNHAGKAPHAQGNQQNWRPSVHPATGDSIRPARPRRLPRDGGPMGARSNPAQRQRRLRKSDLTLEQRATVRALPAPLFDTLVGYGIRKGALLQHSLRAVRDGYFEWRKRVQPLPTVGARSEPQGSQLPASTANSQAGQAPGTRGSPEEPPAVERAGAAGNDQPAICRTCTQHRNLY